MFLIFTFQILLFIAKIVKHIFLYKVHGIIRTSPTKLELLWLE